MAPPSEDAGDVWSGHGPIGTFHGKPQMFYSSWEPVPRFLPAFPPTKAGSVMFKDQDSLHLPMRGIEDFHGTTSKNSSTRCSFVPEF